MKGLFGQGSGKAQISGTHLWVCIAPGILRGMGTGVDLLIYISVIQMFLLFEFCYEIFILLDFLGCVFEVLIYYL